MSHQNEFRRRDVLYGLSVLGATSLAGCTDVTKQQFEATAVTLPPTDQEELLLSETLRDSTSVSRTGPNGDLEITVTSHFASYSRQKGVSEYGAVRTAVGQYTKDLNGGQLKDGATLTSGSELTSESQTVSAFEMEAEVDPAAITLLAPAGLRTGADGSPISTFNGAALERDTVTLGEMEGVTAFEVPGRNFWPGSMWETGEELWPGSMWVAETGWHPGRTWIPRSQIGDSGSSTEEEQNTASTFDQTTPLLVFVEDDQSFAEVFGVDLAAVGGRPVEPGETLDAKQMTVASVGSSLIRWEFSDGYGALFENGRPAALGGAVFDLAVLSTPSASAAGVEANPIVSMDTETLLANDTTRKLLREAGISDADDVRWVEGPKRLSQDGYLALDEDIADNVPESLTLSEASIIDETTTIETYAGVVSGRSGSWAVGIHIARATPDDHVMAIGMQRSPLEAAGGVIDDGKSEPPIPFPIISWKNWYLDARAMMGVVVPQLTEQRG